MEDLARFGQTRDPVLRNELAVRHLPLVKFVARKMSGSLPSHIEFDDLVSWGCLGLLDSLDKFDSDRGTTFSTYAVTRIRGAILDGLQQMDWAPKQITSKVRALRRVRERLAIELGYEPSVDEIAEAMECGPGDVRGWLLDDELTRVKPLADRGSADDDETTGLYIDVAEAAGQEVAGEVAEIRGRVARVIGCLDEREQTVFLMYYRDGKTLRQIATDLGVSVSLATHTHTQLVEHVRLRLAALG